MTGAKVEAFVVVFHRVPRTCRKNKMKGGGEGVTYNPQNQSSSCNTIHTPGWDWSAWWATSQLLRINFWQINKFYGCLWQVNVVSKSMFWVRRCLSCPMHRKYSNQIFYYFMSTWSLCLPVHIPLLWLSSYDIVCTYIIIHERRTPRDTKLACNAQRSIGICKKLRKKQIFGWFERGLWNQNIPLHVVEMSHKTKHIHDRDSSYVSVRYFFCLHHTVTHTQTLKKNGEKNRFFFLIIFFFFMMYITS